MTTATAEETRTAAASFVPRRFLRNGHVQTIAGNFLHRIDRLPPAERQLVEVVPAKDGGTASQVLCHCHLQPAAVRAERLAVVIVHGLEGSSDSQYAIGNANKLWNAGCSVIRMNMRNCGGTEQYATTLYHSGLSGDVEAVMRFFIERDGLSKVALVGYSMGGNLALKLAGDLGSGAPPELRAVVGVSPAIDLGTSADALHEPLNRIYEIKFLRSLVARYRRKARLFPELFDVRKADGLRSLRDFDDRVTAVYAGFTGADDYYYRAASARVVDRIAVPTLVLHSQDDPFVRLTAESRDKLLANPHITYIETAHGGHCAFLDDPDGERGYDGYWAESTLLKFLLAHA